MRHFVVTLVMVCSVVVAMAQRHSVYLHAVDKDTTFLLQQLGPLQRSFTSPAEAARFVNDIPTRLIRKGYITASVDSVRDDSLETHVAVFAGETYRWAAVKPGNVDVAVLRMAGYQPGDFKGKPLRYKQFANLMEQVIRYYENHGYPFVSVVLDSIQIGDQGVSGVLNLARGKRFKVDTIRVTGTAKIHLRYLENYLGIKQGDLYDQSKINLVYRKLNELQFLSQSRPPQTMFSLGGSALNLNIDEKNANQANILIGFLPNNTEKKGLLITGEAKVNLSNAFGRGEFIGVDFQKLQPVSPRLQINAIYPYLFNTLIGMEGKFEYYQKDSAYRQVNYELGINYLFSGDRSVKIFYHNQANRLGKVDTNSIIYTRQLPENIDADLNSLGAEFYWNATNYRLNPQKGFELRFNGAFAQRRIRRNVNIMAIEVPDFDPAALYDSLAEKSNQIRIKVDFSKYLRVAKRIVFKAGFYSGTIIGDNLFKNEVYQIGGFRLLRGFDEQSIYASQYYLGTAELRYLLARNSYFFIFSDGGYVESKYNRVNTTDVPIGVGAGITFETRAGILNVSYAVGRTNEQSFQFRQSKIHFGYINYF
jgi:outer membrane protein assembly factor BamA